MADTVWVKLSVDDIILMGEVSGNDFAALTNGTMQPSVMFRIRRAAIIKFMETGEGGIRPVTMPLSPPKTDGETYVKADKVRYLTPVPEHTETVKGLTSHYSGIELPRGPAVTGGLRTA